MGVISDTEKEIGSEPEENTGSAHVHSDEWADERELAQPDVDLYKLMVSTAAEEAGALESMVSDAPADKDAEVASIYGLSSSTTEYNPYSDYKGTAEAGGAHSSASTDTECIIEKASASYKASTSASDEID